MDAYKKGYAAYGPVMKKLNAAGSIMAGLTFMQGGDTRTQLARNDDFKQETAYDHLFLEAGIGGALPGTSSAAGHPFTYVRPAAFMGVGNGLTPPRVCVFGDRQHRLKDGKTTA